MKATFGIALGALLIAAAAGTGSGATERTSSGPCSGLKATYVAACDKGDTACKKLAKISPPAEKHCLAELADAMNNVRTGGSGTVTKPALTTVSPKPPVANAGGPYAAPAGKAVILNGTADDPNALPVTYEWDLSGSGAYRDATTAHPMFSIPAGSATGTVFVVCLRVVETKSGPNAGDALVSRPSCATVRVQGTLTRVPARPVASPGGPYTGKPGATVSLDGSGSSAPDGGALSYGWDLQGSGSYTDSHVPQPQFRVPANAPKSTEYGVCLEVTETSGSGNDVVSVPACTTVTVD